MIKIHIVKRKFVAFPLYVKISDTFYLYMQYNILQSDIRVIDV